MLVVRSIVYGSYIVFLSMNKSLYLIVISPIMRGLTPDKMEHYIVKGSILFRKDRLLRRDSAMEDLMGRQEQSVPKQ